MKNLSLLIVCLFLLFFNQRGMSATLGLNQPTTKVTNASAKAISIMSSPDLLNLVTDWKNAYCSFNPTADISILPIPEVKTETTNQLCFSSTDYPQLIDLNNWKMVIGREVIVSVFNSKNPYKAKIQKSGISSDKLAVFFKNRNNLIWNSLIGIESSQPANLYVVNNDLVISGITNFSRTEFVKIKNIRLESADEILKAINKDEYAIGFCKLNEFKVAKESGLMDNIELLPIDKNGNGRIDNFENIYGNLADFTRGVWVGKYPGVLSRDIYAYNAIKPTNENELAFLSWILSSGHKELSMNGFCSLPTNEIQANLAYLAPERSSLTRAENRAGIFTWILVIALLAGGLVFLIAHLRKRASKPFYPVTPKIDQESGLTVAAIKAPKGIYFDKTHTWAFMEKDGLVKVGMDDFLQHITGPLTRIKLKAAGEKVRKGEKIFTIIRNGKQLNIYAPISGRIKEHNNELFNDTSLLNSSPYNDGWVYVIEPQNWAREIQFLFMSDKYSQWIKDEFIRLKNFIATTSSLNPAYATVILQDGGVLTDHTLADLKPEVWEDFQTHFIDSSK